MAREGSGVSLRSQKKRAESLSVKPTAKNGLIVVIVFSFLVWAMKLSYADVVFWGIFGGGVYFIIYCIKYFVYKIKGKK